MLLLLACPLLLFPGRAAPLGFALLGVQAVLRRLRTAHWLSGAALDVPIGALLLTALVGLVVAPDTTLAFNRMWGLLLGVGCFCTAASLVEDQRDITRWAAGIVLLSLCIAAVSLVSANWEAGTLVSIPAIYGHIPTLLRGLHGSGVTSNPDDQVNARVVAGTMAFLLPLSLALLAGGRGRALRCLSGIATLVLVVTLALSQSPQGLLGLVLALLVMVTWRRPRWLYLLIPITVALGLAWWLRDSWLPASLADRLKTGVLARLSIWPTAVVMLRDMPFTGVGLNNYPVVNDLYDLWPSHVPHAHNVFLQTATDQGLLGLIAFGALFSTAFVAGWRAFRSSTDTNFRAAVLGCVGGCVAYLGFGLWDSMTLGAKAAPALWVMLGLLAASGRMVVPAARKPFSAVVRRRLLVALAAAALVTLPFWGSALSVNAGRILWHRQAAHPTASGTAQGLVYDLASAAARLNPLNSRAPLLMSLVELQRGDERAAESHLARVLTLDQLDRQAHGLMAEILHRAGEDGLAFEHWRQAGAAEALYVRGAEARKAGQLLEAEYRLALAAYFDGSQLRNWWELAWTQQALQRYDEAAKTYSEVIKHFPENAGGYEGLAEILYARNDLAGATQTIEAGLANTTEKAPQLYYLRSRIASDKGKLEDAERDARRAISLAPAQGQYLAWLGDIYLKQQRYAEALAQYDVAAAKASDLAWRWKSRQRKGYVYSVQQAWSSAIAEFEAAVQLSRELNNKPGVVADNQAALGRILLRSGDTLGAVAAFKTALEYDPNNQAALGALSSLQSK